MSNIDSTTSNSFAQDLGTAQDALDQSIERRRLLVQKLKKARREYLSIFDSVPAMIWYRDRAGRILKVNQCAADSVGASIRDLIGKNYYELFPDGAERARHQDIEVMETGLPIRRQMRSFTSINGQLRWASVDRIPLRDDHGQITGVMVFAVDITDQKLAEESLLEAKHELEQTNRRLQATAEQARLLAEKAARSNLAKSELLASSSHDLRTPMNSIVGFSEILLDTPLNEEQKEYVKTIHQSASGLLLLINDILEYSKIEAGKLKIEIVPCQTAPLLNEIQAMMASDARKKGLAFSIHIDERLPQTFFTDPFRLKQCLVNLVGNAIKFTDRGRVAVYACPDEIFSQPCIRFDVVDTGIGIAEDKQDLIFKSFSQADVATSRKYGGTGLGLAITRRLAGLLGGDVRLVSTLNEGSTFSLTLPLFSQKTDMQGRTRLGRRTAKRFEESKPAAAGHILLVETTFPSQLTLTLMLRRFGLEVNLAGSMERMHEILAEQRFDLILLDAAIGIEKAAAELETLRGRMPEIPVILIADQDQCDLQNSRQAGFSECLFRPLQRDHLFDAIAAYLPALPVGSEIGRDDTETSADVIASTESLVRQLPALTEAVQDVLMRSDTELLGRFAELFSEIGRTTGHEALADKAAAIVTCVQLRPDSLQEITELVEQLCDLCDRIGRDVKC